MILDYPYTLAFGVDERQRPNAVAVAPLTVPTASLFAPDENLVELMVQVDSHDFEVSDHTRLLRLPRTGPSRGRTRFDIVARHEGDCSLTATFHRAGNFVHQMTLTLPVVGSSPSPTPWGCRRPVVTGSGRLASGASSLQRRDVGLVISPAAQGGYQCICIGSRAAAVHLSVTPPALQAALDELRGKLLDVVQLRVGNEYVFQTRLDIPENVQEVALRIMARAGARLFQQLFRNPADGADARGLGDWLRQVTEDETPLTVQVVSTGVPIPWSLLYLGDVGPGATLSWDRFLGMRHLVEQIPYVGSPSHDTTVVNSRPRLAVSVNVNTTIDVTMKATFVSDQQQWWSAAAVSCPGQQLTVLPRSTRDELVSALADPTTSDQILYFYGHAVASSLSDRGGPDASALILSDGTLTLADLSLDAPRDVQLPGKPLVVLNACESAELSPLFYDGFVPYFLDKGARGVVGTEAKTPARFATAWAERFFRRLLGGQAIGEAVLELRRELLAERRNPLGLLYAVHCDQDTRISPPLPLARG
ncbi:MAG TPA: CHAT domain-containing protein [Kineosporiaceae bacterium]